MRNSLTSWHSRCTYKLIYSTITSVPQYLVSPTVHLNSGLIRYELFRPLFTEVYHNHSMMQTWQDTISPTRHANMPSGTSPYTTSTTTHIADIFKDINRDHMFDECSWHETAKTILPSATERPHTKKRVRH